MNIPCAYCGAMLNRPPSRIAANAQQFCNFRCLGAYRARPVTLACTICGTPVTVKASRASQYPMLTCGPACLAELRRRNQIERWDSAEDRVAVCADCGKTVTRKPSQIRKYPTTFCSRSCKARYASRPMPDQETGEWVPCEVCSTDVWRTPATRQPHTFCSRKCAHQMIPPPSRLGEMGLRRDKSPRWQGGKSLEPYTEGWGRWRSKEIRNRDGNACRLCKATEGLIVHHIDCQKVDHSDANLITLCRSCHASVHNSRVSLLGTATV